MLSSDPATARSHGAATRSPHQLPSAYRSVPSSPAYVNAVPPSIGLRHAAGLTLSLAAVFGRARRPAIRARPWGGALRVAGLVLCVAGRKQAGTAILVAGCLVPPRST